MIFTNLNELKDRIIEITNRKIYGTPEITEETDNYLNINGGMVWRFMDNDYFIFNNAREGRFGIDEQPKFWVKYAADLTSGEKKVIKFVFYEDLSFKLGRLSIKGFRSPEKESRILDIVRGNQGFMQGITQRDGHGNFIRIIDFISGTPLFKYIHHFNQPHEEYFYETLPDILKKIIGCIKGIAFLAKNGQHHGDIRNDHIYIENKTGVYKWIDYDFFINYDDFDLWSIGNIITYAAAKGIRTFRDVSQNPGKYPHCKSCLTNEDGLLFYPYRIANLAKIYPYIPKEMNDILMKFSIGTEDYFENFQEQIDALHNVLSIIK